MSEIEGYQSVSFNTTTQNESPINQEAVDKVSESFLTMHVDDLKAVVDPLDELRRNQESLIEALMNENSRFEDARDTPVITEMFNKVSSYHDKLIAIKKEMLVLHENTTNLKKRAKRLEQLKEKQTRSGR